MMDCIVIGAGPAGIVATKELLENGLSEIICLEQSDRLGGVFSDSYDNLILTSSVTFSMFSDFWVGNGMDHHFWPKDEAVKYWTDYAKNFNVNEYIRFNSKVTKVNRSEENGWEITLLSNEKFCCHHLILAIGNNRIPRFPDWVNDVTDISFSHSAHYRNADHFEGKNVLVVGGGESGSDIAFEISKVAKQCWVSLRESTGWIVPRRRGDHAADVSTHRGIWDLPREYGAWLSPFVLKLERARKDPVFDALADLNDRVQAYSGIWGIYGTKTLALPKAIAHHGCEVVGDITEVIQGGLTLKTNDGKVLKEVDAIVFSTGYENRVDFMPTELQTCDPRQLYKHMFHPEIGDELAWIGWARPAFGSQFPIMELQSRFAALVFAGKQELPSTISMERIAELDEKVYTKQFEGNVSRIRSLVDYHKYVNDLARIIGCYPPIKRYFFTNPKLWLHLMYGPTQATQFRLKGPGKKEKLAKGIIDKLPISTYNHIVKAGIRGRIRYAVKAFSPFH